MRLCMDWRSVKFDWNRARAFLVTAEEGSLSAAARALGMAQPTLGRQVDALAEELGVVLFERVGRRVRLTEAGRLFQRHAGLSLIELERGVRAVRAPERHRRRIAVGVLPTVATRIMPEAALAEIVSRSAMTRPNTSISQRASNPSR